MGEEDKKEKDSQHYKKEGDRVFFDANSVIREKRKVKAARKDKENGK